MVIGRGLGPEMATGEASAPFGPKKVEFFRPPPPPPMALEIYGEGDKSITRAIGSGGP